MRAIISLFEMHLAKGVVSFPHNLQLLKDLLKNLSKKSLDYLINLIILF